jgi:hypothetical protein
LTERGQIPGRLWVWSSALGEDIDFREWLSRSADLENIRRFPDDSQVLFRNLNWISSLKGLVRFPEWFDSRMRKVPRALRGKCLMMVEIAEHHHRFWVYE